MSKKEKICRDCKWNVQTDTSNVAVCGNNETEYRSNHPMAKGREVWWGETCEKWEEK